MTINSLSMNRIPFLLIMILFLSQGCKKSSNDLIWERSYGTGNALFVTATADSGILSCGELGGKPYLLKLNRNRSKISDYEYPGKGLYSSAWTDGGISVATGGTNGKMLISCIDKQSMLLWDTTFVTGFRVDHSLLCYLGNDEFLAIGSANPDSVNFVVTKLHCVWFNSEGVVSARKELPSSAESSSIYANRVTKDNSGNIYIALTRITFGSEPKATVAKYNGLLQKVWETELYNNPNFSASSQGITVDNSGGIFVSGSTGISGASGSVDNAFSVCMNGSGTINWKKYLEIENSGSSVLIDNAGQLLVLNHNCFIINVLNPINGSSVGLLRTFAGCDSKNTDAISADFDINYDGNLLMSGSKGGGYYLVMKSLSAL
jgi:hypothetical protein